MRVAGVRNVFDGIRFIGSVTNAGPTIGSARLGVFDADNGD